MTTTSDMRDADIVIANGSVITMDPTRRIIADGAVAIVADRIVAVGKRADIEQAWRPARTIDAHDGLIMPGLIDSHNHPVHYLTKGATDDLPFEPRMRTIIGPYEHGMTEAEAYLNACGSFAEMILNGTTCFNDPGSLQGDGVARAARDIGIRGIVAHDSADVTAGVATRDFHAELDRAEGVVERWDGAENGRIRAWFSLNNPHRVSDDLCRATRDRAAARGVGIHAHMTVHKPDTLKPGFKSPVHRYRDLGLLGPKLVLVHLGHMIPEDIEILVSNEVKGVHCPGTSMLGGIGVITHGTIPEMLDAGMVFGLGSDAGAVSRFLDIVRHMYLAAAAHKDARRAASVITCYKAFEMATIDGARTMSWDHEIGSLEPGKKADVTVMDTSAIELHPNPHLNPIANLVYTGSGAATRTVLIDGRIVLEDRVLKTIDLSALQAELGSVATSMLGRIGVKVQSQWPIV